jgi:hypothetical protein
MMLDPSFNKKNFIFCLCDNLENRFLLLHKRADFPSVFVPQKTSLAHRFFSGRSAQGLLFAVAGKPVSESLNPHCRNPLTNFIYNG